MGSCHFSGENQVSCKATLSGRLMVQVEDVHSCPSPTSNVAISPFLQATMPGPWFSVKIRLRRSWKSYSTLELSLLANLDAKEDDLQPELWFNQLHPDTAVRGEEGIRGLQDPGSL